MPGREAPRNYSSRDATSFQTIHWTVSLRHSMFGACSLAVIIASAHIPHRCRLLIVLIPQRNKLLRCNGPSRRSRRRRAIQAISALKFGLSSAGRQESDPGVVGTKPAGVALVLSPLAFGKRRDLRAGFSVVSPLDSTH